MSDELGSQLDCTSSYQRVITKKLLASYRLTLLPTKPSSNSFVTKTIAAEITATSELSFRTPPLKKRQQASELVLAMRMARTRRRKKARRKTERKDRVKRKHLPWVRKKMMMERMTTRLAVTRIMSNNPSAYLESS